MADSLVTFLLQRVVTRSPEPDIVVTVMAKHAGTGRFVTEE
jgi:hypothetical protein